MQIETEAHLLEVLTRPSEALIEYISSLEGPLLVLGAGGKMGPTLCVQALRAARAASHQMDVIAVSRFSDATKKAWLDAQGVITIKADLMDRNALRHLPHAKNVIYLLGMKFGTTTNPALTWAVNALAPEYICERYSEARIVALSTGNVYALAALDKGGSVETDPLTPIGEYANACVARERIFEYNSLQSSVQIVSIRLNYAIDLRYGVLVDIAQKIHAGQAVDVTMGYFNCIWQGDANDMITRSLSLATSPVRILNLTGEKVCSVRETALKLAELMGKEVTFTGTESSTALLSNSTRSHQLLGPPAVPVDQMLEWTAHWVGAGHRVLNKPTYFQVRDGSY